MSGSASIRAAAIAAKSVTPSASPRAPGSTQAALTSSSALAGEPRPVRERCPQRLAPLPEGRVDHREYLIPARRGRRRVAPGEGDQAGVHVGYRPEDRPRHGAGRPGRGVPGQLRRRRPVDPRPKPRRRSATSACTMITPRRSDGSTASTCSSTGTATLYGRLATSTVGAWPAISRRPCSVTVSASAGMTRRVPASDGARSATVLGSSAASGGSISTAMAGGGRAEGLPSASVTSPAGQSGRPPSPARRASASPGQGLPPAPRRRGSARRARRSAGRCPAPPRSSGPAAGRPHAKPGDVPDVGGPSSRTPAAIAVAVLRRHGREQREGPEGPLGGGGEASQRAATPSP